MSNLTLFFQNTCTCIKLLYDKFCFFAEIDHILVTVKSYLFLFSILKYIDSDDSSFDKKLASKNKLSVH